MTQSPVGSAEALFRALADGTRLRLLNLLNGQEICVCYFVGILGTNQPKVSRHLAYLRRAGIVAARRDGKWMHYRIIEPSNPLAARVLRDTLEWLRKDPVMRRDLHLLANARRGPRNLPDIEGAPLPSRSEPIGAAR